MRIKLTLITLFLLLTFTFLPIKNSIAGIKGGFSIDVAETDTAAEDAIIGFFDLRDRESFMQVTNVDTDPAGHIFHIQIFNVADNCNENNFFDSYTPNDTHVYNLRDIQTNDGNDSGVILPDGAYGIFVAYDTASTSEGSNGDPKSLIGNSRILDDNGYEYRTNLVGVESSPDASGRDIATFNFNTKGGVTLSDIVGFVAGEDGESSELKLSNILDVWYLLNVDIVDNAENIFSCRNVILSCVDEDNPLLEALLEEVADTKGAGTANVASFEYGINNSIPHSKAGELLCPGNTIPEGFVRLEYLKRGDDTDDETTIFVGLNNGNGRGSMDVVITNPHRN